ncbi:hypothetical protein GCM10020256_00770 [Streptomyces thermocoprophilus]
MLDAVVAARVLAVGVRDAVCVEGGVQRADAPVHPVVVAFADGEVEEAEGGEPAGVGGEHAHRVVAQPPLPHLVAEQAGDGVAGQRVGGRGSGGVGVAHAHRDEAHRHHEGHVVRAGVTAGQQCLDAAGRPDGVQRGGQQRQVAVLEPGVGREGEHRREQPGRHARDQGAVAAAGLARDGAPGGPRQGREPPVHLGDDLRQVAGVAPAGGRVDVLRAAVGGRAVGYDEQCGRHPALRHRPAEPACDRVAEGERPVGETGPGAEARQPVHHRVPADTVVPRREVHLDAAAVRVAQRVAAQTGAVEVEQDRLAHGLLSWRSARSTWRV